MKHKDRWGDGQIRAELWWSEKESWNKSMKQVQKISSWLVRIKPPGKASSVGKRIRRKLSFIEHLHRIHHHFTTLVYCPILQLMKMRLTQVK